MLYRETNGATVITRERLFYSACIVTIMMWIYVLVPSVLADPDIWWHLQDASVQLGTLTFIHRDLFSSTVKNATWINHEWLGELPYYLAFRIAGPTGLYLVTLVTIEGIFLGLFSLTYRRTKDLPTTTLTTVIGILLATVSFGPRTLLFGWALLVVELLILDAFPRNRNCILALPAVFLLWINAHGSWIIGLVILIAFLLSGFCSLTSSPVRTYRWSRTELRLLISTTLLSFVTIFVNPYGWHLVCYPLNLAFSQRLNIGSVEEWAPLNFQTTRGEIFLLTLLLLFASQLITRRRWNVFDIAVTCLGIYSAAIHSRFLFLAALLVMPALGSSLSCLKKYFFGFSYPPKRLVSIALLMSLAWLGVARTFAISEKKVGDSGLYPVHAIPFLRTFRFKGRLFNEYLWGGYLIYNLTTVPVFIDSRVDIFERAGVLQDYLDIIHIKNSDELLSKYKIQYVLFEANTPLVYLLRHSDQWQIDYDDGESVLLERMGQSALNPGHRPYSRVGP